MKELSRTQEKTMRRFLDAFFAVRNVKSLDKITVKDIVTEAGYNRSSFYLYFTDVYDLADVAERSVIECLAGAAEKEFAKAETISMEEFMARLARKTSEYADEIVILSDSKSFRDKFMSVLRPNFSRVSGLDPEDEKYDYLVSLFFSIMLHNISYWGQHRDEITLAGIADMTRTIILPGIQQMKSN